MIIVFPTQENNGIESPVFGHFGSAPHFIVVDSESNAVEAVVNTDKDHQHGQ